MRAVIFLGLCFIAEAIRADIVSEEMSDFATVVFLVAVFMDVIEFILKLNRNDKN